jgi:hypothetical protein
MTHNGSMKFGSPSFLEYVDRTIRQLDEIVERVLRKSSRREKAEALRKSA